MYHKSRFNLMPPAYGAPEPHRVAPTSINSALFNPFTLYPSGSWPEAAAAGQWTADGRTDAVLVTSFDNDTANDQRLHLFAQTGGVLSPTLQLPTGVGPMALVRGDLDHDGLDDLAVVNHEDDTLGVFLQSAPGTLAAMVTYPTGAAPDAVAVGDFNTDLRQDIAVSHAVSQSVAIFYQQDDGTLADPIHVSVGSGGFNDLAVGDLDHDGRDDLVLLRGAGYNIEQVAVFYQQNGALIAPVYRSVQTGGFLPHGLSVGDVTGDGRDDIVVTAGGNVPNAYLNVLPQLVNGELAASATVYDAYHLPESVAIRDVNHDGRNDVVTVHAAWLSLSTYTQKPDGTLNAYVSDSLPYTDFYRPGALALADVSSDGALDVLIASHGSVPEQNGLVVLTNATGIAPTSTITTPLTGAYITNRLSPTYRLAGRASSSAVTLEISDDGGLTWQSQAAATTWAYDWTLPLNDGIYVVLVRALDAAGRVQSPPARTRLILDTAPPTGQVLINGDAARTDSLDVELSINGVDAASGVCEMRLRNQGETWGAWQPFADTVPWTLAQSESRTRTVEVQLRDCVGNESEVLSDSILYELAVYLALVMRNYALMPPPPDFSLSVQPASQTITRGHSVAYSVAVQAVGDFTQTVSLSLAGAPADATVVWGTESPTPGDQTTLAITPALTGPIGVFTLTVTGEAGPLVHERDIILSVLDHNPPPTPNFALAVTPVARTLNQGDATSYTISLDALHGFADPVALIVSGLPPSTTIQWGQNPVTPSDSTWLTVTTASDTPADTYTLIITGTGGGQTHADQVDLTVDLIQMPNLVVEAIATDPIIPVMDQPCEVQIRIANRDTGNTFTTFLVDWYVNLSVPPTTTVPGDESWFQTGLDAGEAVTLTRSYIFDAAGTYTMYAQIDRENAVVERDETDNVLGPEPLIVSALPLPDLLVTGLSLDPASPMVDEPVTLTVQIRNRGTLSTALPVRVDAYLESTPPLVGETGDISATVAPLAAGETALAQMPYTFTQMGEHTLYAQVDTLAVISESVESNNVGGPLTYTVLGPDFVLDVWPNSQVVTQGQSLDYTVTVTAMYGFTQPVTLAVDGVPTSTTMMWSANPVTPTDETTLVLTSTLATPTGTHILTITGASGELTHAVQAQLTIVPPSPDFALSISPTLRSVPQGQAITYTAVLTALFGFTDTVSLELAGLPAGAAVTWAQNPVSPNVTTPFTITTAETTTMGLYPLTITGIGGGRINVAQADLEVTLVQMPNLVVEAITTEPPVPVMGQSCQLLVRIANSDTQDAVGTFSVDWYLNPASPPTPGMAGDQVWSQPGLAAGQVLTLSKSYVFNTAGTHTVYAQIDRLDVITERNEDDNVTGPVQQVVSAQPQPDLLITALSVAPVTPTAQQPATLTMQVKNQGTLSTTYPVRVDAYLTSTLPGLGDTGDVSITIGSLEAGEMVVVQIPYVFAEEGAQTLYAQVDTLDAITESIESNNVAGPVVFDVAPPLMPNLVIEAMSTVPATPVAGESCEVRLRVTNPDTGAAIGAFAVDWYVDPTATPTSTMVGDLNWIQNGLDSGQSVTLTHTYIFTESRMYTLYAQVDRTDVITERNEADNLSGPEILFVSEPSRLHVSKSSSKKPRSAIHSAWIKTIINSDTLKKMGILPPELIDNTFWNGWSS